MDDLLLIEAVEKYIRGEMTADDRLYFENLRKSNPEVDQLVVEHTLFLQQIDSFNERRAFKSELHHVHADLVSKKEINTDFPKGKAKIVYLWKRYKRVAAIAASIAGITTLAVSLLVNTLAPKADSSSVQKLGWEVEKLKQNDRAISQEINVVKSSIKPKIEPGTVFKGGGTGFLIDAKGYIITNAHVLNKAKNIVVSNNKGEQFIAEIIILDPAKDIAILKIKDKDFKSFVSLPYGFKKSTTDIAEQIYTLGYPKNEIVYSEGYLSAKSGFNGDTLSCQLGIAVNDGNSGGPVLNRNGEIIGILSTKERKAEGVAFAIQSRYMLGVIDDLKKDTAHQNLKMPAKTNVSGLDKVQQVKKIQDCVFMIRSY